LAIVERCSEYAGAVSGWSLGKSQRPPLPNAEQPGAFNRIMVSWLDARPMRADKATPTRAATGAKTTKITSLQWNDRIGGI